MSENILVGKYFDDTDHGPLEIIYSQFDYENDDHYSEVHLGIKGAYFNQLINLDSLKES
ncbi:hypothetical protein [uncultured Dokdonia sp.]|uniref:hypothetical protein n=1 Tax=uncultured Dokdonia sp. TaxID=575653 RepID=UPI0026107868|nr:hypothetical protein [uncultured Dokdonia sp.]